MRLQRLIWVTVSLRSSESEGGGRRGGGGCGFTPRGGKRGRGHKPLSDRRSKGSPTPRGADGPPRPMGAELDPPVKPHRPIAASRGEGSLGSLLCIQRGTPEDRAGERKSNRRQGETHGGGARTEGGGLGSTVNRIFGIWRPHIAPDKLRADSCSYLKLGFTAAEAEERSADLDWKRRSASGTPEVSARLPGDFTH